MYETFENLPESKKEQILQVCIEEFAQNGYENTSTNTIVRRLGISKGLLFLYFKSKKNLYLYIVERLMDELIQDFFERFSRRKEMKSLDIFDHVGEYYKLMMKETPYAFKLMLEAILKPPSDLKEAIDAKHDLAHDYALGKVSLGYLKEDTEPQIVMDMIHMASYHVGNMIFIDSEGNADKFSENVDMYAEKFKKYISIIKYGAYK